MFVVNDLQSSDGEGVVDVDRAVQVKAARCKRASATQLNQRGNINMSNTKKPLGKLDIYNERLYDLLKSDKRNTHTHGCRVG